MNRPKVSIDEQAIIRLQQLSFPGNIRELENMIERAIVVGNGKRITIKDLPLEKAEVTTSVESLEELEKQHIAGILSKYSWNISAASKALKVDRVTLYNKIKKYNLRSPRGSRTYDAESGL